MGTGWDTGAVHTRAEKIFVWRLQSSLPVPEETQKEAGEGLFVRNWSDGTGSNGFKPKDGKFVLDITKKTFPVRVARPCHRVPREAVALPGSLGVSKGRMDGAWNHLG